MNDSDLDGWEQEVERDYPVSAAEQRAMVLKVVSGELVGSIDRTASALLFFVYWPIYALLIQLPYLTIKTLLAICVYAKHEKDIHRLIMDRAMGKDLEGDYGGDIHNMGSANDFNVDFECGRIPAVTAIVEGAIQNKLL